MTACPSTAAPPLAVVEIRSSDATVDPTLADTHDVVIAPNVEAGACVVHVLRLTDTAVFRGPHPSPARDAQLQRLDPKTASEWRSRDHALQHLLCTYRIDMNGTEYTYVHLAAEGLAGGPKFDTASCSTPAAQTMAETRVHEFTHECKDPHGGAYDGFDLQSPRPYP
jgi:hypothetical protein